MAKQKLTSRNKKLLAKRFLITCAGGLVFLICVLNLALWAKNEIAKEKRAPIETEIAYWEGIVAKTPTYRDGYLKLTTLYWQLGNKEKAKDNLKQAEEIDPNYEKTKELMQKLGL